MAGESRRAADALAVFEALAREPWRFDFFQTLRRLECLHRARPRLGTSLRPDDDPIRLGQEPSLAFAPATMQAFVPGRAEGPPRLEVRFFGLLGPNGPLPLHLTEYARDRLRNSADPTFARFLDVFHHRMLSLFYRAWANARPTVHHDRPDSDRFALYVGATLGIGAPALRHRDALPDAARLYYSGLLSGPTRPAEGLRAMLAEYFRMPARIEQMAGEWLRVPAENRARIGRGAARLGGGAVLGDSIWQCQQKFRAVLGPLHFADYQRMIPGSRSLERLRALVRSYVGDELVWDVKAILRKEEVPPLALGGAARLGWTSWLVGRPPEQDREGLLLDERAIVACARAGSDS